jgi:hypothetical protein
MKTQYEMLEAPVLCRRHHYSNKKKEKVSLSTFGRRTGEALGGGGALRPRRLTP